MANIIRSDRAPTASGNLYKDASASPLASPQTINNNVTLTLTPPPNALNLVFRSNVALTFSETSDQSRGKYLTTVNTDYRIPCSNGYAIYLKSSGDSNTVYFYFEML
jgi:hypothetical protein